MKEALKQDTEMGTAGSLSRRKFLNYAGAIAGAGVLIASCKKDDDPKPVADAEVSLGANDVGLLNYAYLMKQMTATFYTTVVKTPYLGATDTDMGIFTAMRDHEIAHREVIKNMLGTDAIPMLENEWGSIDFKERNSVWSKSQLFEGTLTAGLNGICRLLVTADFLLVLSKMAMVNARHSALINDQIYMGSFSEKTDSNGLEVSQDPQSSLEVTRKFFKKTISGIYLPKY